MNKSKLIESFPDFTIVQRSTFCWLLSHGLSEEFNNFSSIIDISQKFEIQIFGQNYQISCPRYNYFQSKQLKQTYSLKIYIPVQILELESFKILKTEKVFICDLQ